MKKIFFLAAVALLTLFSCSEEELILEGDSADTEVVADDANGSDTNNDNDNNSDGNNDDENNGDNNEGNSDDNSNTNDECNTADADNEVNLANEILKLVNEHRKNIGKSALALNCEATRLAIAHTEYMISKNEISHDDFSARFQELQQKVGARSAGENVAAGYNSAASVMTAWLNSSGHKANIEGNFTHIGIAAIKNAQGRLYYTQLFYR